MVLRAPPEPPALDPLASVWTAGRPLFRVHHHGFGPGAFNPGGGRGRFHPFSDANGVLVPTLYAADTVDGALSETVFRSVPVQGPARRVAAARLAPLRLSVLAPERDLLLAALHGHGLRRLGVTRRGLIDTEASHYRRTAAWAAALHAAPVAFDGLEWVSRQHDVSRAVVLFGDRVAAGELALREGLSLATLDGDLLKAARRGGVKRFAA